MYRFSISCALTNNICRHIQPLDNNELIISLCFTMLLVWFQSLLIKHSLVIGVLQLTSRIWWWPISRIKLNSLCSLQWRHNNAMAPQITGISFVYSTVCSSADQRKHQSYASLAFVRGIHRWPVNSPHKRPVTGKIFLFDDVIMSISISQYTDSFF